MSMVEMTEPFSVFLWESGIESSWNMQARELILLSIAVMESEMPMVVVSFARYAPEVAIVIKYAKAHSITYIFSLKA